MIRNMLHHIIFRNIIKLSTAWKVLERKPKTTLRFRMRAQETGAKEKKMARKQFKALHSCTHCAHTQQQQQQQHDNARKPI